jgi:serine/threonine-protein kinase
MTEPVPSALLEQVRAALGAQYDIERPLGAGGMGSVLLARDKTLDRSVALKVISPELSTAKSFRARFLQEARTVARLRHPNIVAVYAAGESDGLLYFVMEYVPGESLRDLIEREGRVEPARATRILRQLADALAYAHSNGIIHRDIKPENILLDAESGRAMITDFGVAQALSSGDERMTGTGFIVGSPRYMSPEQAAGERNLDGRSDIYSLGLVGYEMLSGEPAFGGESAVSIIAKQITAAAAPLSEKVSGLPAELAEAIDRALAKDPSERWQTGAELAAALGEPSGEVSSGTRVSRPAAKKRRPWALAGAAAALLGIVALVLALTSREDVPDEGIRRMSYLIVPFDNQTGNQELAWLREGSVNMLTLNLSEWRDLTVVDYERTLDLLEEADIAEGERIGREDALRLARRAGVWTTVLGVISRRGQDSISVTARAYDVATGGEVQVEEVSAPASADPRGIFDSLSRRLLNLLGAPELVIEHAQKTSTSLEAYRAYLAGVKALNSFDLDSADVALQRAVAADSTFALAYYKLAVLRGWRKQLGDTSDVYFSRLAAQYAARLPERERRLVDAHLALSEGIQASMVGESERAKRHLADAQAKYGALVVADSTDAEVWYGLGDAYFHVPTSGAEYTGIMNQSMRAFQKTLALDSTLHLAYPHLLAMYTFPGNENSQVILHSDSLVQLTPQLRQQLGQAAIDSARSQARARALATAQNWVSHDPNAKESHEALANAHAVAGDYTGAAAALRAALARRDVRAPDFAYRIASYQLFADEPRAALAALRDAMANHGVDSLRRHGTTTRMTSVFQSASVASYLGMPSLLDSVAAIAVATDPRLPGAFLGGTSTERFVDPWIALNKAAMGMDFSALRKPLDDIARNFDPNARGVSQQARGLNSLVMFTALVISRDTMYANTLRRWAPQQQSVASIDGFLAIIAGDTAAARAAAEKFKSPDYNKRSSFYDPFIRAEVLAELGDLRGAIAAYEELKPEDFTNFSGVPDPRWAMYARSYLARGQMYEELGERAQAEAAYRKFLELWSDAEPALQAQVSAARAGLVRLSDRPAT